MGGELDHLVTGPELWGWIIEKFGDQGYEDCAALYGLAVKEQDAPDAHVMYANAVELLRELFASNERIGGVTPPELAARVRAFLNAADWHDAVKNFMDGE